MKILTRKIITALLATVLALSLISCGKSASGNEAVSNDNIENAEIKKEEAQAGETVPEESASSESDEAEADETSQSAGKNGDIYVLCTSDVHCGVNQGFGYAGLVQVREDLENEGYDTFLIDNGDAIQGDTIGTLSEGETIIELMNKVGYDMAVPGNHEFDYGMDKFLELADQAEFPYISCNFNYKGELVFKPYLMKEIAGKKIAFVGISTPQTLVSSSPASFKDENGEYVYGFCQDDTGEALYEAVQKAVDSARAEGADYVYACGHLGNEAEAKPWTYADVISHTNGIDIFFDGHSHDTDQIVMKNKDGAEVTRSAMGTKMHCIAYSHISADEGIAETNIWSWPNEDSAPVLLNIQNDIRDAVDAAEKQVEEDTKTVYGKTDVDLVIFDPVEKDSSGNPIRIVRRMETNLG
ncbi:MAG: metallophosphoesterase, partial [Lachnospiraceae bacterium]|nr:metallophosphoesterase [Lachnospiraceae bacterium]